MRAIARILMLLTCMVSFTGFSTTTDLIQDSDVIAISDFDVGDKADALFVVVIKSDFVQPERKAETYCGYYFGELSSREILSNKTGNLETTLKEHYKPPLIQFRNIDKNNYKPPLLSKTTKVFTYCRARDGIRQHLA